MPGDLGDLFGVVENGDAVSLRELLSAKEEEEQQKDLVGKRSDGITLLHAAAFYGNGHCLQELIDNWGVDVNIRARRQAFAETPLHLAAATGHLECIELLVDRGADILAKSITEKTPYDLAVLHEQQLCIIYLARQLEKRMEEMRSHERMRTELVDACKSGDLDRVKHLVEVNNLGPCAEDTDKCCLLASACAAGHIDVVKYLVSKGASLSWAHSVSGNNLLHTLASSLHHDASAVIGRFILEQQPILVASSNKEGSLPLHVAAARGNIALIDLLLLFQKLMWKTLAKSRLEGDWAAMVATEWEIPGLSSAVAHDAMVSLSAKRSHDDSTPLHIAVRFNHVQVVDRLLSFYLPELNDMPDFNLDWCCVQMSISNAENLQPVHEAVLHGRSEVLQKLFEHQALEECPTTVYLDKEKREVTLLEMAVLSKSLGVVQLVLQWHQMTSFSEALTLAVKNGFNEAAITILMKVVHDKCVCLFREKISHEGLRSGYKLLDSQGIVMWEHLNLPHIDTAWLQMATFIIERVVSSGQEFLDDVLKDNHSPAAVQQRLDDESKQSCNVIIGRLRPSLMAWPGLSESKITELSLSNNSLKSLPLCVFQLPSLKNLTASNNALSELPGSAEQEAGANSCINEDDNGADVVAFAFGESSCYNCPNLQKVVLHHNQLKSIPPALLLLDSLLLLDLSDNHLELMPFEMWMTAQLQVLHLRNNKLTRLPCCTAECSSATVSRDNTTSRQLSRTGYQRRLTFRQSHFSHQLAASLPSGGSVLYGHDSLLAEQLDSVDGSDTPSELCVLTISDNQLEKLPSNLCCLAPSLEELDVSSNCLTRLNLLEMPATLRSLRAVNNQLKTVECVASVEVCPYLPPAMSSSSHTPKCEHLPTSLEKLRTLRLSGNMLNDLPVFREEVYASVDGAADDVDQAYDIIADSNSRPLLMPSLMYLYINNNRFFQVPEDIQHLRSLTVLHLGQNQITFLPSSLGNLTQLFELNIDNLKLENLHSTVLERGNKHIIHYLRGMQEKSVVHRCLKLMIVGRHGKGKTTLMRVLTGTKSSDRTSTVGVDVLQWTMTHSTKAFQKPKPSITFSVWDFGGQEEYYATHQCFISRRSLYIVVWNMETRIEGICELQPWLLNIQARAPGSPVIIVGTHLDKVVRYLTPQEVASLQEEVRKRYCPTEANSLLPGLPNIVGIIDVSAVKGTNIRELKDLIYNSVDEMTVSYPATTGCRSNSNSLPKLMEQKVPASYHVLECAVHATTLKLRREGRAPVLSTHEYLEEVRRVAEDEKLGKLPHPEQMDQATSFLHDNGVLLHYDDTSLADLYFVDPKWLCKTLAQVVTVEQINSFAKKGVMKISCLPLLFKDRVQFPKNFAEQCINLMERFEVGLRLSDSHLLIPSMLPSRYEQACQLPSAMASKRAGHVDIDSHLEEPSFTQSAAFYALPVAKASPFSSLQVSSGQLPSLSRQQRLEIIRQEKFQQPSSFDETKSEMDSVLFTVEKTFEECKFKIGDEFVRLYITPYVPSGFWPRLISRLLADKAIARKVEELISPMLSQGTQGTVICWNGWKNGAELTIRGCPVLRVCRLFDTQLYSVRCNVQLFYSGDWKELGRIGHCGVEVTVNVGVLSEIARVMHGSVPSVVQQRRGAPSVDEKRTRSKAAHRLHQMHKLKSFAESPLAECRRPKLLRAVTVNEIVEASSDIRVNTHAADDEELVHDKNEDDIKEKPDAKEEPEVIGAQLGVWLLSRSVNHIDSLLYDWYGGLHSNEATEEHQPSIMRIVPCPRCAGEIRRQMSEDHDSYDLDSEQLPGSTFQMVSSLARNMHKCCIIKAASQLLGGMARSSASQNIQNFSSLESESSLDGDGQNNCLYSFSLCDLAEAATHSSSFQCSRHGSQSLFRLAPDLMFADLPSKLVINDHEFTQCDPLAKGGFGEVFRGRLKRDNMPASHHREVAIKTFTESVSASLSPQRQAMLIYSNARAEISIMAELKHKHILKVLAVCRQPIRMMMPLAPKGDLKAWINLYKKKAVLLQPQTLLSSLKQIALAMEYLHDNQIVYRDLKPRNTLVWAFPPPSTDCSPEHPTVLRLADYGISRFAAPSGLKGDEGSRPYMAPEVLKFGGKEGFTEKVDVYAFGANLYELLTLVKPYGDENFIRVVEKIRNAVLPTVQSKCKRRFFQVKDLMVWCMAKDPLARPTFKQIREALEAPSFLQLVHKVRLTQTGSVTACSGWLPVVSALPSQDSDVGPDELHGADLVDVPAQFTMPVNCSTNCVTKVMLGDALGWVNVIDYHYSTRKRWKACESRIMDLLTVNKMCWVASECDGLLLYHSSTRSFVAQWAGRGLHVPVSGAGMLPNRSHTSSSPTLIPQRPAFCNSHLAGTSSPVSMSWGVVNPEQGECSVDCVFPFRIVSLVTVPRMNCVLVNHSDGSLAVFCDNPFQNGNSVDKFEPIVNHDPPKGHEVCCMAQVQRKDGRDEVWLGLYSGEVAVVDGEELTKPGLLKELSSRAHLINVSREPSYRQPRRIKILTTQRISTACCRPYVIDSRMSDSIVWLAMDRNSTVSRWDIYTRTLVRSHGTLNCRNIDTITSSLGSNQSRIDRDTRVTALLPLSDKLIVGTGGGFIIVANLSNLQPLATFYAYRGSVTCLLPYSFPKDDGATSSARSSTITKRQSSKGNELEGRELVLSCGQAYRGLHCTSEVQPSLIGGSESLSEGELLMWVIDQW